MRQFYLYISMVLLALWTGCTADDEQMTWKDDPNAVIVKVTASGLATKSNPIGDLQDPKASTTSFNVGDKIGISCNNMEAIAYTLTANGWEPETGKYLKWESDQPTFKAFYPFEGNSFGNFTPVKDQTKLENLQKADFMQVMKGFSKIPDNHTLELSMGRMTARIIVTVNQFHSQFGADEKVKEIKFFGDGIPYTLSGNGSKGTKYIFLIPRQNGGSGEFLSVTTSSGVTVKRTTIPELKAGHSYSFNLNIGKDALEVKNITVEGWKEGEVIPGNLSAVYDLDLTGYSGSQDLTDALMDIHSDCDIKVTGKWNDEYFDVFKRFLINNQSKISLDMSGVTGMTAIPYRAFSEGYGDPSALYHIVLPTTVTSIGKQSFMCTHISSIDLTHVTSVEYQAFQSCSELADIAWPKQDCTFTRSVFTYTKWSGNSEKYAPPFTIPSTVIYANDDDEANRGFFNGGYFEEITIPADFKGTYDNLMQSVTVTKLVVEGDISLPATFGNNATISELDISNCTNANIDCICYITHSLKTVHVKTEALQKEYQEYFKDNYPNIQFIVKGNE